MGSSSQSKRQPHTRHSVFISSTSRDLIPHRSQVSDTLLRLGLFPVAMEQFGAQGSGDATTVCSDKVAEAEAYLGIVAWRYGYVPPGETRSVTHLEYLEARRLGLPCYLFLAHPDTQQDYTLFPPTLRDPEQLSLLLEFRTELQKQVVDYFTTPDDLARKIAAPLNDWLLKEREKDLLKGPRPITDKKLFVFWHEVFDRGAFRGSWRWPSTYLYPFEDAIRQVSYAVAKGHTQKQNPEEPGGGKAALRNQGWYEKMEEVARGLDRILIYTREFGKIQEAMWRDISRQEEYERSLKELAKRVDQERDQIIRTLNVIWRALKLRELPIPTEIKYPEDLSI